VQVFVKPEEDFLGRILRILQVAEQPQGRHEHVAFVLNHNLLKRAGVPGFGPCQQASGGAGRFIIQPLARHHQGYLS